MLTIILIIAVIALIVYGILWHIAALALLQYMRSRYMLVPVRAEMRVCVGRVIRKMLRGCIRSGQ